MASKVTEDAVDAYLTANWTETGILNENEGEPVDGSPFVRIQFPLANVERVPVDRRVYREDGAFRIIIGVERGAGTDIIRDYGEQLATLFRDITIPGGIRCFAPSEPFKDDESDRGLYFVGTLVVPFERYFSG